MFWRILRHLLRASRGRLTVALIALSSGAAITSTLLNTNLDAEQKFTHELRTLGANVVVAPPSTGSDAALADAAAVDRIVSASDSRLVIAAPYLYVPANAGTQPVILGGTWFDQVAKMNSWWKVDGGWVTSRDDSSYSLVGQAAARQFGLAPGSHIDLRAGERSVSLTVNGIITAGGDEENPIITTPGVAQDLAGLRGPVGLVQQRVFWTPPAIGTFPRRLARAFAGL